MKRLAVVCCALGVGLAWGARAEERAVSSSNTAGSEQAAVDLFTAVDAGQVAVQVFARDARGCRVLVTNQSGQPLRLKWPASVAAVPVLAQLRQPEGFTFADGQSEQAPQQLGLGNPQSTQQPGGFFSIPPERTLRLRVPAVCLNHGQPDPRPQMAYRLTTLEAIGAQPGVAEVCRLLGTAQLGQKAAQAAVWHLNNGRTWEELAKQKLHSSFGPVFDQPFFTAAEIRNAKQAATRAREQAARAIAASSDTVAQAQ